MIHSVLSSMTGGWFIGDFTPTLFKTSALEVAIKEYAKGQKEPLHYHKVATEITVIVTGRVRINSTEYSNRCRR